MKTTNKILIFYTLLTLVSPSFAMIRGNNIYPLCEHVEDTIQMTDVKLKEIYGKGYLSGFCYGTVYTAFQAIRGIGYVWSVNDKFANCMEKYYGFADMDANQVLDMTMKYLKENPNKRNVEINIIMASMLHDAFPSTVCKA